MSSITLRDIRKSYANGPRVLHGVNLDIGALRAAASPPCCA